MNTYELCIAFGDGKPLKCEIVAKTGLLATTLAFDQHPSAKTVHLLGMKGKAPVHPLFTEEPVESSTVPILKNCSMKDQFFTEAAELRIKGWSYASISQKLGIGKTTVRTWLTKANIY
jgi:hypothetical protein